MFFGSLTLTVGHSGNMQNHDAIFNWLPPCGPTTPCFIPIQLVQERPQPVRWFLTPTSWLYPLPCAKQCWNMNPYPFATKNHPVHCRFSNHSPKRSPKCRFRYTSTMGIACGPIESYQNLPEENHINHLIL